MKYWLTTHWPPLLSGAPRPFNLHIQDEFRDYVREMDIGHRVLIYQTGHGPGEHRVVNGMTVFVPRSKGKQAVIRDVRVATALYEREDYVPENFGESGVKNFKWQADTDDHRVLYVPRLDVNEVFGWGDGHNFHGFNAGRGIREITPAEYSRILAKSPSTLPD